MFASRLVVSATFAAAIHSKCHHVGVALLRARMRPCVGVTSMATSRNEAESSKTTRRDACGQSPHVRFELTLRDANTVAAYARHVNVRPHIHDVEHVDRGRL